MKYDPRDVAVGRRAISLGLLDQETARQVLEEAQRSGISFIDLAERRGFLPSGHASQLRDTLPIDENSALASGFAPAVSPGERQAVVKTALTQAPSSAPSPEELKSARRGRRLPQLGEYVDGYELVSELGRGGMGAVFKARRGGKDVALKLILSSGEKALARFEREARAIAEVDRHPNIVGIHSYSAGALPYLVLDYVDGQSLESALVEGEALPPERSIEICVALASALAFTHDRGLLHRDLKPDNILIRNDDQAALLTDFGLARDLDLETLTKSGDVLGTPQYMSPEQAAAERMQIGPRSDLWSLGVIFYRLSTGFLPFNAPSIIKLINDILFLDPVPPRRHNPALPAGVEAVILRLLEKEPERRYATAQELLDDLRCLASGESIETAVRSPLLRRARKRVPLLLISATLLAVALFTAQQLNSSPRQTRDSSQAVLRQQRKLKKLCKEAQRTLSTNPAAALTIFEQAQGRLERLSATISRLKANGQGALERLKPEAATELRRLLEENTLGLIAATLAQGGADSLKRARGRILEALSKGSNRRQQELETQLISLETQLGYLNSAEGRIRSLKKGIASSRVGLVLRAQVLLARDDGVRASRILIPLLKQHPEDRELREMLVRSLNKEGKFEAAMEAAGPLQKKDLRHAKALIGASLLYGPRAFHGEDMLRGLPGEEPRLIRALIHDGAPLEALQNLRRSGAAESLRLEQAVAQLCCGDFAAAQTCFEDLSGHPGALGIRALTWQLLLTDDVSPGYKSLREGLFQRIRQSPRDRDRRLYSELRLAETVLALYHGRTVTAAALQREIERQEPTENHPTLCGAKVWLLANDSKPGAVRLSRALIRRLPADPLPYFALASASRSAVDSQRAEECFRRSPTMAAMLYRRAKILLKRFARWGLKADRRLGLKLLKLALRRAPWAFPIHRLQAAFILEHAPKPSREFLTAALFAKIVGRGDASCHALASISDTVRTGKSARRLMERAQSLGPEAPYVALGWAMLEVSEKHFSEGIAWLRKILAKEPGNLRARIFLKRALEGSGQKKAAATEAAFLDALSDPKSVKALELAALANSVDADPAVSLRAIERAVVLAPRHPFVLVIRANVLMQQPDEILKWRQIGAYVHILRAIAGGFDSASAYDRPPPAYLFRSTPAEKQAKDIARRLRRGEFVSGEQSFFVAAIESYAFISKLRRITQLSLALAFAERGVLAYPGDPAVLALRGIIRSFMDRPGAGEDLRFALPYAPDSSEIHLALAVLALRADDLDAAITLCESAKTPAYVCQRVAQHPKLLGRLREHPRWQALSEKKGKR